MKRPNPFVVEEETGYRESASPLDAGGADELNLSDLLAKIRRRWKLIAVLVVVAVVASAVKYSITPKQYQATTRVQIERRNLSGISGNQTPWLESLWNMEFYPTQYKLLESRGLAERVFFDLGLEEDPRFNPSGKNLVPTDGLAPDQADDEVLGRLADRLRSGLTVSPVRNTQLADITYRSSSPELAARVANGYAEAFINWGIKTRSDTVGRASTFLTAEVESLKRDIKEKESKIRSLSRGTDIISLDKETNVGLQRFQSYNEDYMQAKANRIEKEIRYQELLDAPPSGAAGGGERVEELMNEQRRLEEEYETKLQTFKPDWPMMAELRAEIDQVQEKLARATEEGAERARQTAAAEYQSALRRERALQEELEQEKAELLSQSSTAVELSNLRVELASSRELLENLIDQQSETEVAARLQDARESNIRIVDRALVPRSPFRPSLRENLGMGLGLGLLLGLGSVVLLEFLDRTLKSADEVERRLALPNLAVIPDVSPGRGKSGYGYGYGYGYGAVRKRARKHARPGLIRKVADRGDGSRMETIEKVPHDHPRLSVSEAYRALRTALLLSSAEKLETVAITSPGSGEGKSATSTNLAVVMAQLGRRVLLIDGDLRKPRLHEVFRVSNRTGLVNVLAGGEDPSAVITTTDVSGLHLIPSGPTPPNPSELLSSARMQELLRRARDRFDFVIIDTPPVLAVTDATVIGSLTDGVILCLRAGKVLREDAKTCRDRLLMADVKILGTVLNRHREEAGSGRSYHYYYAAYAADESESGSAA